MSRIRCIVSEDARLALNEMEYNEVRHMLDDGDAGNYRLVAPYTWNDVEDALEELADECGAF